MLNQVIRVFNITLCTLYSNFYGRNCFVKSVVAPKPSTAIHPTLTLYLKIVSHLLYLLIFHHPYYHKKNKIQVKILVYISNIKFYTKTYAPGYVSHQYIFQLPRQLIFTNLVHNFITFSKIYKPNPKYISHKQLNSIILFRFHFCKCVCPCEWSCVFCLISSVSVYRNRRVMLD